MSENEQNINNEIDQMLCSFVQIPSKTPILIAGTTASGKSALALEIAAHFGGIIINADAIQVYRNWRILTARPSNQELTRAPHALYGHVNENTVYSVGAWLRDIKPFLNKKLRPIITGGTGLYFSALTKGLANIPEIDHQIRKCASARLKEIGLELLARELHSDTAKRIDIKNPARVLRAWEVETQTKRALTYWQNQPQKPPLLPIEKTAKFLLSPEKSFLNQRITQRFDNMIANGALDEVRQNMPNLNNEKPAFQAIGARQLANFLCKKISLEQAREKAIIATRQYAKRQRTWFRTHMSSWTFL